MPSGNTNLRSQENLCKTISVLGCDVDLAEHADVIHSMTSWLTGESDRFHYIVNTGMHGLMEGYRDPSYKRILNSANLFAPDGILLILASRVKGGRISKKATGPDLMWQFLQATEEEGYRHFFYGDTPETLKLLKKTISAHFDLHKIVGMHSPPFRTLTPQEDEAIITNINQSKADILWVGLGTPKQERWMFQHRHQLNVTVAVGVGASFKFVTAKVKRAPNWVCNAGLEWLWRLCCEPKRIWRRVFIDSPQFIVLTIMELVGLKKFQ